MRVERTFDEEIIREVLTKTGEDASQEIVDASLSMYICLAVYEDSLIGALALRPITENIFEIHISMFEKGVGREALSLGVQWAFENTPAEKIIGLFKENRKDVRNVLKKAGLKYEGRISMKKEDILIYGVDK